MFPFMPALTIVRSEAHLTHPPAKTQARRPQVSGSARSHADFQACLPDPHRCALRMTDHAKAYILCIYKVTRDENTACQMGEQHGGSDYQVRGGGCGAAAG